MVVFPFVRYFFIICSSEVPISGESRDGAGRRDDSALDYFAEGVVCRLLLIGLRFFSSAPDFLSPIHTARATGSDLCDVFSQATLLEHF
jgi:hypothetical protein